MTGTPAVGKPQRAYDWIRERIANLEFTPGYRLVLGTIAAELDMSVVPVREAIRRLEAEGLVTYERNVGARVTMVDDTQYRHSMQLLGIVDGAATALAARHLTPEDLRRARVLNRHMADLLDHFDPRAFTTLNQQFHSILFGRCPNPHMLELVEAEWTRLGHLRDSTFSYVPDRARASVQEHEDIVDLIENGAPPARIEDAVRSHRWASLDAYMVHEHPGEARYLADFYPSTPSTGRTSS